MTNIDPEVAHLTGYDPERDLPELVGKLKVATERRDEAQREVDHLEPLVRAGFAKLLPDLPSTPAAAEKPKRGGSTGTRRPRRGKVADPVVATEPGGVYEALTAVQTADRPSGSQP